MVGRQVDKVILFPLKRGSKCGKMDKKEAPGAEVRDHGICRDPIGNRTPGDALGR